MNDTNPRSGRAPTPLPVRLLRVRKGERALCVALSSEILGFMGHYDGDVFQSCRARQGRCKWCPGPAAWRGYFAALVWSEVNRQWEPYGVEVSGPVEVTMRPQYRAGTRWSLFKPWPVRDKHQRIVATLRGANELTAPPPPFDFLPLVRALYQDPDLLLDLPNPTPAETLVSYPQPDAPDDARPAPAAQTGGPIPSLVDEVNRRFGAAANGSEKKGSGK
jgi:hypothetical protein